MRALALRLALTTTVLLWGCSKVDLGATLDHRLADVLSDVQQTPSPDHPLPAVDSRVPDSSLHDVKPADAPPPATVTGTWYSYNPFPNEEAVAGATVCLYLNGAKTSQCTTTNATGDFSIAVPANVEAVVLMERADMMRQAIPVYLPPVSKWQIGTFHTDTLATVGKDFSKQDLAYPPVGKGWVIFNALAGAQVALAPSAGLGPVYWPASDANEGDPPPTSIVEVPGWSGWGGASWYDLVPGTYEFTFTHPKKTCKAATGAGPGWPPKTATVRGPVIEGFATWLDAKCI
jgi:hypothetical protein